MKGFIFFLRNLSLKIRKTIFAGFFISLIIYILNFLIPLAQKDFINNSIKTTNIDFFNFYILAGIFFLKYVFDIIDSFINKNLSIDIYEYLRLKFLEFFRFFKLQKVKEKGSGYFIQKYFMGIPHADMYSMLFSSLYTFIFDALLAIAAYYVLFRWIFIISIFAIANTIFDIILVSLMSKFYSKENQKEMEKISKSAKVVSGYIDSFTSIGIFSTFVFFKKLFKKEFLQSLKHYNRYRTNQIIYLNILQNFKTISFQIATLFFVIYYLIKGKIDFGTLIAINIYLEYLKKPQQSFFEIANKIASLNSFFNGFIKYFNSLLLNAKQIFTTKVFNKDMLTVQINNISLKKDNNILIDKLNLKLNNNEKIGIVGLSGEGKSLLLKLLIKEMQPDNGNILINGINLNKIAYGYYLSRINIMPQDVEILNKDLIYNITLGKTIIEKDKKEILYKNIYKENFINLKKLYKIYSKYLNKIKKIYNKNIKNINYNEQKNNKTYKDVKYNNKITNKDLNEMNYLKKLNKLSICYLLKISKKLKFDDNFYDTLHNFGIFLKEGDISFLTQLNKDFAFNYFCEIGNFLKENFKNTVKRISDFHFNKYYILKEDVNKVIIQLELKSLEGRDFGEKGHFISGGERQKIALARFILKKDYDFFIIDEPFSSLDSISENRFLKILKEATNNKTGFIISHKLNVINTISDKIVVIDNGKIAQIGKHEELILKEGIYKNLVNKYNENRV